MRTRTGLLAAATITALLLTGCAANVHAGAGQPNAAETHASAPAETTAPPLVATPPSEQEGDEAKFLTVVRDRLSKIRTQIPNATDEQLLAVGYAACERVEAGMSNAEWSGIEGEQQTNGYYMDSGAIAIAASTALCPFAD